jgi:hypothetical protein
MAILYNPLKINGVISADKTVLQNLNDLCSASGCWLTYDYSTGKWSVIINRTGTSVASFNNSNIIGNIDISGTGVTELYNRAAIEFPHKDLKDETDYVEVAIPENQKFPNEVDNILNIELDCINDPVQAQYLASVELKQSRVDKVIEFRTDYSKVGIKAGDLIDVTNSVYGFNAKLFRVIKVVEDDSEGLNIAITALEYSADVYSTAGLVRNERTKKTGILLRSMNPAVQASETVDFGAQMVRMLAANAGISLLNKLFKRVIDSNGNPTNEFADGDPELAKALESVKLPKISTITGPASVCEGDPITVTVSHNCASNCFFNVPTESYQYEILGVEEFQIDIDTVGIVEVVPNIAGASGSLVIPTIEGEFDEDRVITVKIGDLSRNITIFKKTPNVSYVTTANPTSITEGQSTTITFTTSEIQNGTLPYAITGSATGKITTALTGNLTITNGTASIVVQTTDDSVFTGTQSFTLTVGTGVTPRPCGGTYDYTATVSVLDNDTPPPQPPADKTCLYAQVPAVWCAVYDGADNQMKSVTVRRFVYLPIAQAGEPTVNVPTSLVVTKGNPSTVTVGNTIAVASSANLGGEPIRIITSFNSVSPLGLITGTGVTVYGYFL